MKLLLVNFLYWPDENGGSQISTRLLAEKMVEKGHDVTVLTFDRKSHRCYHNGVYVIYLKNSYITTKHGFLSRIVNKTMNYCYHLAVRGEIKRIVLEIYPDLIHTNCIEYFSTSIWSIANQFHIPIVHTARDYYLTCLHSMAKKNSAMCSTNCKSCKAYSLINKSMLHSLSAFVGVSDYMMKQHLQRGLLSGKTKKYVIYNCVSDDLISNEQPLSCRIIGYMGRLCKEKGIELLLDNFCKLDSRDVRLIVAGKGATEYINALKFKYSDSRIEWRGYMKQNIFYKEIDLLVVPSIWPEPFGRVVVEAAIANRPTLVSNRGGMPEILGHTHFGTCFNVEDSSLYEFLSKYTMDDILYRKLFTEKTLNNVYSNESVACQYERVYAEALEGRQ